MKNNSSHYVLLGLTSLLCILLLVFRFYISENFNYRFLIWNLILAWIPLFFSHKIKYENNQKNKWYMLILCVSWLVFFPNAPYIITDLIHLKPKPGIPLWFDLLLIITFVWNGLLIGFISLMQIHQTILTKFSQKNCWGIISFILLLSGYGIYLGRFQRLNSWYIITHPFSLFSQIVRNFQSYDNLIRTFSVTFSFGIFLMISYATIYYLSSSQEILTKKPNTK